MISVLKFSLKNINGKVKMVLAMFFVFTLPYTLPPTPIFASGAGTTAANFLKVSMNARAMALAGAYGALADDSGAVFSNPAGLASFDKKEMGFGFTSYFQDAKMANLSYASDMAGGRFGLGLNALSVTGIEKRGLSDATGIVPKTGSFDATDAALILAFARRNGISSLVENVDTGFAAKLIKSDIDSSSAFAAALDAGVLYRVSEKTNLSMVMQNLGTEMKYEEEGDPLPLVFKLGFAHKYSEKTNLLAEASEYFNDEKFYAAFAAEHWIREALALRAGYKFGYDTSNLGNQVGLSLGFGLKVSGIGIDYAFLPFGELGNIHRFGFWMQF